MALVVPNTADVIMLKYIVNQLKQDGTPGAAGGHRVLRLYSNNLTPSKSTTLTNLTEVSAAGYSAVTLLGANWTVSTSTAGTNSAVYSEQSFVFTAAVTAYGYYVTTTESPTPSLLWVERFSTAPFTLPAGGGEIAITPRITLD